MSENFAWYEVVHDDTIEQGDLLNDFPIVIQPDDLPTTRAELIEAKKVILELDAIGINLFNVVVMTQSCGFAKLSDDGLVTLCQRINYTSRFNKDRWKDLLNGRVINFHLLNKCELAGHEFEYQVVSLDIVFSVRYGFVKKVAAKQSPRIRLLPPYREHLAQAFARRFMRVGLPIDLPRDYPYK